MYVYAAILIAGLVAGFTGGWKTQGWRHGAEEAVQAREDRARQETREAAQQGAADAIAQIKVVNTTIHGKTETIVRDKVVYRDCRHDPDGLRSVNAALAGRETEPASSGGVPSPDAPKR